MKTCELSDYPAIKKLASALHRLDASQHGAAIMIGAGFSRSAARHVGGDKKMPLWNSFTQKLISELNPGESDLKFSDPLRIAEEYRAYFGQAALNDRIRAEINNDAWNPSELYQSLLELPWSDVMTTNWDTLLERAAAEVHGPYYTPVTKPTDLTWASSPRIVKLHGTIGITDTLIAAQEDYRSYPQKFAPFVNFARQVFIENELCLLGFSGDDPNFLHWAGWVRDHLADHARKIYLVGALNLTAARRKHLESLNIAPIDLWDAVKQIEDSDLRHQVATEKFLRAMQEESKLAVSPHEWSPHPLEQEANTENNFSRRLNDHQYAANFLSGQLDRLRQDRESYPGWLVCPPGLQWKVNTQIGDLWLNPNNIAKLSPDDRAKLLYETAWRYGITFEYINPWLADELFHAVNTDSNLGICKRQKTEIALILLKNTRWIDVENSNAQEQTDGLIRFLEKNADYCSDCSAELAYHQALVARDNLDYAAAEKVIEKIIGEDPVWKLRQASLMMELGKFDEGKKLISNAYRELQERYRYDQNSIGLLSRLAWAHFLLRAATQFQPDNSIKALPITVKDWKCDPWTWIEDLREKVNEQRNSYLRDQNPIEPLFEQGSYQDNSKQYTVNSSPEAFLLLDGLTRDVGIPLRSGSGLINVNLLAGDAEKLILAGGTGNEVSNYTLSIRAASSESAPAIKGVFSRIGVARTSKTVADVITSRVLSAIEFWKRKRIQGTSDQQAQALSALRVLVEVLARLVVRADPQKAKEIFRLGVTLGGKGPLQHAWLFDALDSLLSNSLNSIPNVEQGDVLEDALAFPLQQDIADKSFPRWPNPVVRYPRTRDCYPDIGKHIDDLLNSIGQDVTNSSPALLRLLPLCKDAKFLTKSEHDKLAQLLWGDNPTYHGLPPVENLYPHVFLILPSPEPQRAQQAVRLNLFTLDKTILENTQKELHQFPSREIHKAVMAYGGIANAAANGSTCEYPTAKQAKLLFDHLVDWRPWKQIDNTFGFEGGERKRLLDSIGNALSYSIVPALHSSEKNIPAFERLKQFYESIDDAICVIPALVHFTQLDAQIAVYVAKTINKSLNSRVSREVSYAAYGLQKWGELSKTRESAQLNRLISKLMIIIESGRTIGLHHLLLVAGELFKQQHLSNEKTTTLIEAIPEIFDANDYVNINPSSPEAISASSLREACVKLAQLLAESLPETSSSLNALVQEAPGDALPEVRFALNQ